MIIIHSDPDFLAHYGVLGMKWGVRRYQNPDGTLTTAGRAHYKDSKNGSASKKEDSGPKHGSTGPDAAVAAAIAQLAAVVVPLGILAASNAVANGREKKQDARAKKLPTDPKTGLAKKDREYTVEEDMKCVNPARGNSSIDTHMNCTMCSLAFDLRRRGYDVRAARSPIGLSTEEIEKFYKKGKFTDAKAIDGSKLEDYYDNKKVLARIRKDPSYLRKTMPKEIYDTNTKTLSEMAKSKNGTRGMLTIVWAGTGSGHCISYQVENGSTVLYDCQSGKKVDIKQLSNARGIVTAYMRTDNLEPDYKHIKEQSYVI